MTKILNYQRFVPEHPSSSEFIVLVHGLFGNCDNLNVIRRHFDKDYTIINIDLPDHGSSPWSQEFDFKTYAEQIYQTLLALNVDKAHFIAHSLGGKVCMYLSYLHKEIFKSFVCLDIAPVAYSPRHENVFNGLHAVDLAALNSRKDAAAQLSQHINDSGTQSFLLKSLYQDDEAKWQWRFNLELLTRDYEKLSAWELSDQLVYEGEIFFVKGTQSDYILPEHQSQIMTQFPNAKAKLIDAGHWLHVQKPHIVNSVIMNHLRKQ